MNRPTVLVVGSINADDAIRVARLPGPGETVRAASIETALGGKGANQAIAAARAGAEVRMVGAVGADGPALVSALAAAGIGTEAIARLEAERSGRAIVLIDDEGENSIVVQSGANARIPMSAVEHACANLGAGDAVLLQHEVPIAVSRRAAELARAAGAAVLWNAAPAPASRDELVLGIDLLIVNEHELVRIADLLAVPPGSLPSRLRGVGAAMRSGVVCTLGGDGASYLVDGEAGAAPARAVEVVDTTAAGDTFVGYLAALAALPFADRLRTALAAGSLAVTRHGAAASIPHLAEVERSLDLAPLGRSRA